MDSNDVFVMPGRIYTSFTFLSIVVSNDRIPSSVVSSQEKSIYLISFALDFEPPVLVD